MKRQDAENIITEYLKPLFGFALKRCKNVHDAQDLSQEIVLKAFRALLTKDDIADTGKFIWTVAHNTLANYYRDTARSTIGISIDDMADVLPDPDSSVEMDDTLASIARLQREIAYLSGLQRRIVIAYYFENKKQDAIAAELGIPTGTVKWHLFEAKKELKRGMDTMRKTSELKFNPIKFDAYGINGSIGSKPLDHFFRSPLSQNICYCVRNEAKTVNEIADDLGVSPVYVEGEVEHLEKYGYLLLHKDKYLLNFIISEPTEELLIMQNEMYHRAAELFANDLFDELTSSGILDDDDLWCHSPDEPITLTHSPRADHNFILWSLIPYIAAQSGSHLMQERIPFEQVATLRPDGAHNITHATVITKEPTLPGDYVYMKNWCGPSWNNNDSHTLWRLDTQWSEQRIKVDQSNFEDAMRTLLLYAKEYDDMLAPDEYVWLAERGFVKTNGEFEGLFKSGWQVVILANSEIKHRLLAIGDRIKEKYKDEFERIKAPYTQAALDSVPKHLRKNREYELQYVFHSDGWFLLHCIDILLKNGKLKLPTEQQRKSMSTLIFPND